MFINKVTLLKFGIKMENPKEKKERPRFFHHIAETILGIEEKKEQVKEGKKGELGNQIIPRNGNPQTKKLHLIFFNTKRD